MVSGTIVTLAVPKSMQIADLNAEHRRMEDDQHSLCIAEKNRLL